MRDRKGPETSSCARAFWAMLLLAGAACDLTVPWGDGAAPAPPQSLRVTRSTFDTVELSWSPRQEIDGWEIEWRAGDGAWASRFLPLGTPATTSIEVSALPELTAIAVRVRAVSGGRRSGWAETGVLHAIRPPTSFSASGAAGVSWVVAPITLRWTNASAVATDVRIERGVLALPDAPWTEVTGAALAGGVAIDLGVEEGGGPYAYRIRAGAGTVWSEPVEAHVGPVALWAPADLSAEVVTTGVSLSWTSRSTNAIRTTVWLDQNGALGTRQLTELPPGARGWLHEGVPVWPVSRYQVSIADAGSRWASTGWTSLSPFRVAGPPALDASALTLPAGDWVARDAAGRFHVVALARTGPGATVHRATADGHEPFALANATRILEPGIVLDAAGNPHVVYERQEPTLPYQTYRTLVHAGWDGTEWILEDLAAGHLLAGDHLYRGAFGLAEEGALHVVYEPYSGVAGTVHLVRTGSGTTESILEPDPGTELFSLTGAAHAVAPDGAAHVVWLGFRELLVATALPDGTSFHEPVPIGTVFTRPGVLDVAAGTGGDLAISYVARTYDAGDDYGWNVIRRTSGSWSAPERVLSLTLWDTLSLSLAASPDLSTLVASAAISSDTSLFVRDDAGWRRVRLGPGAPRAWTGLGPAGAWALHENDDWAREGPTRYSLFTEAP